MYCCTLYIVEEISWYSNDGLSSTLWKKGRVKLVNKSRAVISGNACIVGNIVINSENSPYFWEIYVRRPSNSFWVGFLPCISTDNDNDISNVNWQDFEWVYDNGSQKPSKGFGIENEYGYWYVGKQYTGSGVGRGVRRNDHIRFRLDTRVNFKVCKGSIQSKMLRSTFYRGNDIPNSCLIAIINYSGEGEFEIYNNDPEVH